MVFTVKQIMKAAEKIGAAYGLPRAECGKITGYINNNCPNLFADILAGDLSGVPGMAAAAGVVLGGSPVQDSKEKSRKGSGKKSTTAEKPRKESRTAGGAVDIVTGAAVDCETVADVPGVLPDNVPGLVMDIISSFCEQHNIQDLSKERQPRWSAACMVVGGSLFKKSKILHDMEREKKNGGIVYDVGRVSALADVWLYMCSVFCKAPMVTDFAFFAGVSDSWLYGVGSPDGLTPARSALLKKLKYAQESGLSSMIVDGRQNPTGALAALNHWHGWTQTREVIHTAGTAAASAPGLPVFDANGGLLTDSGTDSGGSGN